jgi:hypothetical protein
MRNKNTSFVNQPTPFPDLDFEISLLDKIQRVAMRALFFRVLMRLGLRVIETRHMDGITL